jgi:hypothetical protein
MITDEHRSRMMEAIRDTDRSYSEAARRCASCASLVTIPTMPNCASFGANAANDSIGSEDARRKSSPSFPGLFRPFWGIFSPFLFP